MKPATYHKIAQGWIALIGIAATFLPLLLI